MINLIESEIKKNWYTHSDYPLVSITCIAYNHEKFISEALDSFLMQKTNFPFEIIIDDDCSTDNTAKIIQKYVEKFPTLIKANLRKVNIGPAQNAIKCFERSCGKYVAFCEGDDFWTDANKLQFQIDQMKKYPMCNISFHPTEIINSLNLDQNEFLTMALDRNIPNLKDQNGKLIFAQYNQHNRKYDTYDCIAAGGGFMPTESIIIKKVAINNLLPEFKKTFLSDYLLQILGSLNGDALYLNKVMSVSRLHSSGIYTSILDDKMKLSKFELEIAKSLIIFDQYSKYHYHALLSKKILSRWKSFLDNHKLSLKEYIKLYEIFFVYLDVKQKNSFYDLISNDLSYKDVNYIRDTALTYENNNINFAYELMYIAFKLRPSGPFIRKKLELYRKRIK